MANQMTKKDCVDMVYSFCSDFCRERRLLLNFRRFDNEVPGWARTLDFDVAMGSDMVFMDFGCGDSPDDAVVSGSVIAKMAVAVGHEISHLQQALSARGDVSLDTFKSLLMLGHADNMSHYCAYYKSDLLELEAERNGIITAFDVLQSTGEFTEDDCDRMLVNYVNERKGILGYGNKKFGSIVFNGASYPIYGLPFGKFDTMDEVMAEFDYCVERCAMIEKPYPRDMLTWSDDEFLRTVGRDRGKKGLKGWDDVFEKFQNESDGFMQAKMMACVSCYVHPERQAMFASLRDYDLSSETVFGKPFPETSSEVRVRLGLEKARGLPGLLQSMKYKERKISDSVRASMYEGSMLDSVPIRAFDSHESDDMDFGG